MVTLEELITDFLNPPDAYQSLTVERVLVSLIITFGICLFIFFMYRKTFKGVIYTRNFNIGLVLTGLVVNLVVLPISSNVALSLGMVGALSIVRFRTAIKDPGDIVFTFWTIATGIICGAGLYMIALVGTPVIGLFLFVLSRANIRSNDPYLLVVHYAPEAEEDVQKTLPENKLRSRTTTQVGVELMVEVRLKPKDTPKVDDLLKIKGVRDASLVSYTPDVS